MADRRSGSVPLNGNMRALGNSEEREVDEAANADDVDEVIRLVEPALEDPRMSLPRRIKYERLLACLPDRNPWTHLKNSEHALSIIEEYLGMASSRSFLDRRMDVLIMEQEETPEQRDLDHVKRFCGLIEDLEDDIRTEGDYPEPTEEPGEEQEADTESEVVDDKSKTNKHSVESDEEKEEERDVKKGKFVEGAVDAEV